MSRLSVLMSLRPTRAGLGLGILCLVSLTLFGISAARFAGGNDGQPAISVGALAR